MKSGTKQDFIDRLDILHSRLTDLEESAINDELINVVNILTEVIESLDE